ncbi:hypothetical protein F5Y05DRAFT_384942 [Hypoxylon sp. FL0543]|nr:hypothetical protein F5Y05DRAFT_384942 [Hypoxylon sp. FL0543]
MAVSAFMSLLMLIQCYFVISFLSIYFFPFFPLSASGSIIPLAVPVCMYVCECVSLSLSLEYMHLGPKILYACPLFYKVPTPIHRQAAERVDLSTTLLCLPLLM